MAMVTMKTTWDFDFPSFSTQKTVRIVIFVFLKLVPMKYTGTFLYTFENMQYILRHLNIAITILATVLVLPSIFIVIYAVVSINGRRLYT